MLSYDESSKKVRMTFLITLDQVTPSYLSWRLADAPCLQSIAESLQHCVC